MSAAASVAHASPKSQVKLHVEHIGPGRLWAKLLNDSSPCDSPHNSNYTTLEAISELHCSNGRIESSIQALAAIPPSTLALGPESAASTKRPEAT